ncbi:hypothetical protein ABMA27_011142 [Loxostege sticticalis]|uniref:Uncharacterized protein n=1 Tax=Loxostege sticticalis TaxID=481309 RepID=A0ABR3H460_LOXSC
MASKYKSPSEVELVAICRLEFYKKQKNWKFCQDVCKKKASEPAPGPETIKGPVKSANSSKSILNKTYNLDTEVDPSDLNNAFLDPDPDKIPPVTPPDPINLPNFNDAFKTSSEPNIFDHKWPEPQKQSPKSQQQCSESQKQSPRSQHQWPKLDQQWQEPEQKWPELEQQWSEPEQQWPKLDQQWPKPDQQWQEPGQQWPESNQVWSVPEMPEHGWQNVNQCQEWGGEEAYYPHDAETLRAYEMDRGWPEPCPKVADDAYSEQMQPEAVLGAADAWLRGAQRGPAHEDARSRSMDSVVSFMRGAAAAPHSSEVDLNITDSDTHLSSSTVACLSARQLAAGVSRHAAALRQLLDETRARASMKQQHPPPVDYRTPNAFNVSEERPTRDVDLFHPQKDSFVAGSFRNETIGRGRGRLHRERLIGIGMGRPYRL